MEQIEIGNPKCYLFTKLLIISTRYGTMIENVGKLVRSRLRTWDVNLAKI